MEKSQESRIQKENAAPMMTEIATEKSPESPIQKDNAVTKPQPLPPVEKDNAAPMMTEIATEKSPESPIQRDNAVTKPQPVTKLSFSCNSTTPDRLKVPKAFKYPERYTSPTDQMMSPVSKRLLGNARIRKSSAAAAAAAAVPLPPSGNPPKPMKIQSQALPSSLQPAVIQT